MFDPEKLRIRGFKLPHAKNSKGAPMTHYAIFLGETDSVLIAGPFQKREWAVRRLHKLGGEQVTEREARLKAERLAAPAAPKKSVAQRVVEGVASIGARLQRALAGKPEEVAA